VSILYRTKPWLTLAQLVPAWTRELANATTTASEFERLLWHYMLEDIINGRLDNIVKGQWGLAHINDANQPVPISGRVLIGQLHVSLRRIRHRLLVTKEAVFDIAHRHDLRWVHTASNSKENATGASLADDSSGKTPAVATARKPRRGPEPGTVDRFSESDRAVFPEIERIMRESRKSLNAATFELASAGRIKGTGTAASLARRLAKRYRKACTDAR
jgi:hypothetical protein